MIIRILLVFFVWLPGLRPLLLVYWFQTYIYVDVRNKIQILSITSGRSLIQAIT